MKKVLGLILGVMFTVSVFANGVVTYKSAATAEQAKQSGVFEFNFDTNFSADNIKKTAQYYTSYFTVTVAAVDGGNDVTVQLVEDNDMARRVITRFFVSLEVKEIKVNGTAVALDGFITKYVMK